MKFWITYRLFVILVIINSITFSCKSEKEKKAVKKVANRNTTDWRAPNESEIPNSRQGALIKYGKDLLANTAKYLGPKGSVASLSNGMNCQNCHLIAGTQLYANSFSSVASLYPKYSARRGNEESIEQKVNDCMERSLNGKKLDTWGKEMQAMVAYIKWVGAKVPKGTKPAGSGTQELTMLERAADPAKGKALYASKCITCHKLQGEGMLAPDSSFYIYPPLWGKNSYNVSAGIFRLSKLAGFIKNNMPFGATYKNPQLTEEQAWDIAAYINSQLRSKKLFPQDWPVISKKPVDYPFGPYTDGFSEKQHKYGPFKPIVERKVNDAKEEKNNNPDRTTFKKSNLVFIYIWRLR